MSVVSALVVFAIRRSLFRGDWRLGALWWLLIGSALDPRSHLEAQLLATAEGRNEATRIGLASSNDEIENELQASLHRAGLHDLAMERARRASLEYPPGSVARTRWLARWISSTAERDSQSATDTDGALAGASKIVQAFLSENHDEFHRVWMEYRFEEIRYLVARRAAANYLASPANPGWREQSLGLIRSILLKLEAIDDDLRGLVTDSPSRAPGKLMSSDVLALRNRVQLLRIDLHLLRSDVYPKGSDEAIAAGTDALATIDRIVAEVAGDWAGHQELELARFRSWHALSRDDEALKGIEAWLARWPSSELADRGIALAIRICLGQNALSQAAAWVARVAHPTGAPEIQLAIFEWEVAEWQAADRFAKTKPDDTAGLRRAEQLLARLMDRRRELENAFGAYWGKRVDALIVAAGKSLPTGESHSSSPAAGNLELIKTDIRQRIAAGDIQGAIERIDQAEATALELGDRMQAFALAKSAIGLRRQQAPDLVLKGDTEDWVGRGAKKLVFYRDLADASKIYDSLAAIYVEEMKQRSATEESASQDSERLLERYRQHLLGALENWPSSERAAANREGVMRLVLTTPNADWLLASCQTAPHILSPEMGVSLVCMMELGIVQLSAERKDPSPFLALLQRDAVGQAHLLNADFDGWPLDGGWDPFLQSPLDWSRWLVGSTSVEATRISSSSIAKWLQQAMKGSAPQGSEGNRVFLEFCRQPRLERIGFTLALGLELSNVLRRREWEGWPANDRSDWAVLLREWQKELELLLSMPEIPMSSVARQGIDRLRSTIGGRAEALARDDSKRLEEWLKRRQAEPRLTWVTLELARYHELGDVAEVDKGLVLYRQLAAGAKIGSDLWFESRIGARRCLLRQGKSEEAKEALAILHAMVPEIPPRWKLRSKD